MRNSHEHFPEFFSRMFLSGERGDAKVMVIRVLGVGIGCRNGGIMGL